ncbi:MAG TPA: hypothetical protein VE593_08315, partial [Nitrososphaeraceae archaeon]|nr:hypothetical protein [Nitrososphaeraceae archaeon]
MSYPEDVFSRMYAEIGRDDRGLVYPKEEVNEEINLQALDDALQTNIFNTMLSRRSQRKFE